MAATELAPGVVIGARYRLERLLGEGGMGAVWSAEDTATGQRCALKLMKDPAGDPEAHKRFLREGRAASAVRHPNVVGILDVLEPEGEPPAIAMELLEGESLRAMLGRAQKLPLDELVEIMVPVVSAVGAAHALGIVHRDLKPENIFLARMAAGERVVKVLDFGIAKLTALDGEAMRSTGITTGAVLGTPAYMAPEQVFAEKDLDHRADIWALGIIFYECLSGVCPTEGDNVGQVLKHVVARPFEALSQIVPDLPEELSHLIARMLARDRSQRPVDLHEVLEVLEPFAGTPGIQFGTPAPSSKRASELAATVPLAKTVHGIAPRPRRVRLRGMLGISAAVVLLGVVAARSWWPASPLSASPDAAWLELGFRSNGRDPAALPLLWRAYRLSPFDAHLAGTLASSLLVSEDRAAARGIAADLRAGGLPLHDVESDLILVRVDTSMARFGAALERAQRVSERSDGDTGWILAQRFEAAWHAFELAALLGRDDEVADLLVKRFLDPDRVPLDGNVASVPMRMIAICARASASTRCLERFRSLRRQFPAMTPETNDFLTGAERYVKRDYSGAARAWRPLLGGRMVLASTLPGAMVDALDRTDATELAEQVDQEVMKRAGEFNGATLGHARAARRAFARGDRERARRLAEQVIKAWSLADDEPPALAAMRRLLTKLQGPAPPASPP
jgi:serine/threonine-protein kinase